MSFLAHFLVNNFLFADKITTLAIIIQSEIILRQIYQGKVEESVFHNYSLSQKNQEL